MISCDKGLIKSSGSKDEIMADVSCIIKAVREKFGDNFAETCYFLSKYSDEELERANNEIEKDIRTMAMALTLSALPKERVEELKELLK